MGIAGGVVCVCVRLAYDAKAMRWHAAIYRCVMRVCSCNAAALTECPLRAGIGRPSEEARGEVLGVARKRRLSSSALAAADCFRGDA